MVDCLLSWHDLLGWVVLNLIGLVDSCLWLVGEQRGHLQLLQEVLVPAELGVVLD